MLPALRTRLLLAFVVWMAMIAAAKLVGTVV